MDQKKVVAIKEWPTPKGVVEFEVVLGAHQLLS
ncbi:unnamed protein product [Spirodela intermedia]|uniref:Uncharacterized protein n=1 Tax=Spirodela intermedia TaxID=51605 RepID=A0A7I8L5X6_SPIIN|nr:unnamed protein product [Spirodela intermedia]